MQLVEEGWLHNHARMWFASIWIFTLRLPWELGADFFLRHLLDGDPASNTLSWRWVAGLHTRGKPYLARRDNIREFTEGRHDPAGLDERAAAWRRRHRRARFRRRRPMRRRTVRSPCSCISTTCTRRACPSAAPGWCGSAA